MSYSFYRIHRDLSFVVSFTHEGQSYYFQDVKDFSVTYSTQILCLTLYSGDVHTFHFTSDFIFQVSVLFDHIDVLDANDPMYDYASFQGEYVGDTLEDFEHAFDLEW